MTTVKYKTNIHCGSCIKSVTPVLNDLDNLDFWKVDLEHDDKILEVKLDDEDKDSVIKAVKSAGFEIEEIQ
ncbi:heavy-metal-associated domain-containing protein [Polaribacter sp. Z014]|uniref:heavy-metal-associated domain-containing protein n=1 Tax=unclassified Polaribacter TaxID=196858 RepID=UPI00193BE8D8|nr:MULTISPECIES: heavy-metal-associated domain-containing protein [unclassified Polaribacter]MCL7764694.1 heavy-metal-associated domain-containing protein [Polaribacter sp. Z014]QVY65894.1 heavy-metal-associated domain-containing protein [Polaribacter sp. Q13]